MRLYPAFLALAACSANDDVPQPRISSIQPDHGVAGALVVVEGSDLCQQPETDEDPLCDAGGSVSFDQTPGIPTMWTDSSVTVEVPNAPAGEYAVRLTVKGRTSNPTTFTLE